MPQLPIELPMDEIRALCRRYRVRELAIFGSVLREDFRPESDIDVLVEFEADAEIGLIDYSHLRQALSDLLQRPVDLVPKNGLKALIRDEVIQSSQVIYAAA